MNLIINGNSVQLCDTEKVFSCKLFCSSTRQQFSYYFAFNFLFICYEHQVIAKTLGPMETLPLGTQETAHFRCGSTCTTELLE